MSGGHFDYHQYQIREIADEVEQLIFGNNDETLTEFGDRKGYFFSDETIDEFKTGLEYLRKAAIYAQRIDWLVSGDDGEETFHKRLKEDLAKVPGRLKTETELLMKITEQIQLNNDSIKAISDKLKKK